MLSVMLLVATGESRAQEIGVEIFAFVLLIPIGLFWLRARRSGASTARLNQFRYSFFGITFWILLVLGKILFTR
jgi:hypothetical protein